MAVKESIVACNLGHVPYESAWRLQRQIQQRLIRAKQTSPKEKLAHIILLVEHPHIYTLGKSGDRAHLLSSEDELEKSGAAFIRVDRGGDITYHGPGQLVVYPVLDLDRFFRDIHLYLRELEEAVIQTCAEFDINATRIAGRTGVWIMPELPGGRARKICALGIRCSRWVTMHGLGFNVNTDLSRYKHIIPCGIHDGDVTSIALEAGRRIDETYVQKVLLKHLGESFSADISFLERREAEDFLSTYLAPEALPSF